MADSMDYEETLRHLDSVAGEQVLVYPVDEPEPGAEPPIFGHGLWAIGRLIRHDPTLARRHSLLDGLAMHRRGTVGPADEAADFTFDEMNDSARAFAGFTLWRHRFVESRWLHNVPLAVAPEDWLWVRVIAPGPGLVVVGDFPEGIYAGTHGS